MSTKGISKEAKLWTAFVAKEVKVTPAVNSDAIFLLGRTLLDKETFNKINNDEDDVVHGVQVFYGPFSSKESAREFIANYSLEWPGDNDWRCIYPGQVEVISPYFDPGKADIVHNASLEFQGQLGYNEMQRRVEEIEKISQRISSREDKSSIEKKPLSDTEKKQHILWQKEKVATLEKQLESMKKHLLYLENL